MRDVCADNVRCCQIVKGDNFWRRFNKTSLKFRIEKCTDSEDYLHCIVITQKFFFFSFGSVSLFLEKTSNQGFQNCTEVKDPLCQFNWPCRPVLRNMHLLYSLTAVSSCFVVFFSVSRGLWCSKIKTEHVWNNETCAQKNIRPKHGGFILKNNTQSVLDRRERKIKHKEF